MIRRAVYATFIGIFSLVMAISAEAAIKVRELETQYGKLQGHLKLSDQTVLLFPTAKVNVSHTTGQATRPRRRRVFRATRRW